MFNTIKVNNTDTNYTHSIFDISEYNSGAIYANLSAALAAIPENKLHGGMSVKFILTITQAQYSVVKTENLETEPTGTLLSEAPNIESGTYAESQLSTIFSTLPSETGTENALTYYVAVTVDETTTYTSWVITKVQNSDNKYVQYFLPNDEWSDNAEDWEKTNLWEEVEPMFPHTEYSEITAGQTVFDTRMGTNGNLSDSSAQGHDLLYFNITVGKRYKINVAKNTLNQYSTVLGYYKTDTTVYVAGRQCPVSNYEVIITAEYPQLIVSFDHNTSCHVYEIIEVPSIVSRVENLKESTIKTTDIVDNLTTDDSNKVLSAKQGKVLNQSITEVAGGLDDANTEIEEINNVLDDVLVANYNWQENAEIDSSYAGNTTVYGRGNTIASNTTIYKVVINCSNGNTASPITKIKMQLQKNTWAGDVLTTKVVDFAFTDNNYHNVEFDFSESPITYSGNIYCTVQFNNPFTISIINAADYIYSASCTYTTSSDLENPAAWQISSSSVKAIYANIAYEKVHNVHVTTDDIENEAVTEEKLSQEVQDKLNVTVKTTDIVDNLTTEDPSKPLSAKQGKILNQNISEVAGNLTSLSEDVASIENTIESSISTGYEWEENATKDGVYAATTISGRGNVIASNTKIYKVVVNIGNNNSAYPITQVKMQLRKDTHYGGVLASKIVDFPYTYTDTDFHDLEFDFSDNPITYEGEIYCTVQCDSTYAKFSIIKASDYTYSAKCTYLTSIDFDNPGKWQDSSSVRPLYANIADKEITRLEIKTDNIEDEAVTEEKLSEDVQEKLNTPSGYSGIKANLPAEIVVAAGSRLQLFYRGIVSAINPYDYNVEVSVYNRTTGKSEGYALPRYYQLDVLDYCVINAKTTGIETEPTGENVTEISYPITNLAGGRQYYVKDIVTTDSTETSRVQGILAQLNNGDIHRMYMLDGTTYTVWNITRKTNVGLLYDLTVKVRDNNNDIIDTATSVIRTIPIPSSPATQKNILLFGASVASKGLIADELRRRLTLTSGTITSTTNPLGIGLTNIGFIGRVTGYVVTDIHQEATGGWSWGTFAGQGEPRYRFYVTDGSGESVGVNETFVIAGLTFTVKEKNITNGDGNFSCTYTGTQSGDVPTTGTISFQSGNVNYSSKRAESTGNPFWNPNKAGGAGIDFKFYADTYCNGATVDILISHCGVNDIAGATWNKNNTINSIKAIARAYKQYCIDNSIDGKFILSSIAVPDPTGGFGINYYADGAVSNYYIALRKLFELAQIFEDIANDDEFSSFVVHATVMPESDGENMYPQSERDVNNRNTKKEMIGTNAFHPEDLGHKIIADGIYQSVCDVLQQ